MGLIIHVDGGSRGNPGPAGAGVVIHTDAGAPIHEAGYFLGVMTNNAAEYNALILALQRAQRCGDPAIRVCSDSELLVRQITGEYQVKNQKLALLYRQAQMLLLKIPRWSLKHVPREENRRADQLANLAMDQRRNVTVFDVEGGTDEVAPAAPPPDNAPDETQSRAAEHGRRRAAGHASAEETISDHPATAGESASGARVVHLMVVRQPAPTSCPAGDWATQALTLGAVLPAGICVHAAHALLPTLLAMQNTAAQEFAAVPTLAVRCDRPGCGATFQLSPAHSPNGAPPKKEKEEN